MHFICLEWAECLPSGQMLCLLAPVTIYSSGRWQVILLNLSPEHKCKLDLQFLEQFYKLNSDHLLLQGYASPVPAFTYCQNSLYIKSSILSNSFSSPRCCPSPFQFSASEHNFGLTQFYLGTRGREASACWRWSCAPCLEFFHMFYLSFEVILVQNADHHVYFVQEYFLSYWAEPIKGHCLFFTQDYC